MKATPRYSPRLLRCTAVLARFLSRVFLRVSVTGRELVPRTGAVIVAGNHSGFLDGPLVAAWCPRPVRVLTKIEIYVGPVAGALHRLGQIPLDRSRADRRALSAGLAVLAEGGALGVFPEGTRGAGELEDVQHGIAYLAVRSGATIVPVACIGTAAALPKGAKIPRLRTPVRLVYGAPFQPVVSGDPRARSTWADVAEQIRLGLRAHLETARGATRTTPSTDHDESQGAVA